MQIVTYSKAMRVPGLCFVFLFSYLAVGAELTGKVLSRDEVPVSGARIIIFNELSIMLAQKIYTDRSGSFKVGLPPGSYMIWVTHEGYSPFFQRVVFPSGDDILNVNWNLLAQSQGKDKEPSLKHILRHSDSGAHRQQEKN